MKKLFNIALLSVCFVAEVCYGQSSDKLFVVPPSPTAGTLSTFGQLPFNYSTGTANISIPLAEVKEGSITMPVTLNYNYTGFKPDEPTGIAGLGWSLNMGGVITRTVRGIKDEADNGYFHYGNFVDEQIGNYLDETVTSSSAVFVYVNSGERDGEPDIFNFNFMGNSGSFFRGNDGKFHVVSQKKLKFDYVVSTLAPDTLGHPMLNSSIVSWTVTDEMGFIYKFNDVEYAWSLFETDAYWHDRKSISGWYLSEVISPNGDKIELEYTSPNPSFPRIQASYTESISLPTPSEMYETSATDHHGVNRNYSEEIFLTRIKGTNWDLEFNYDDYSQSILGGSFTSFLKKISTIKYFDKITTPGTPVLIKEISFLIDGYGPLLHEVKEVSDSLKNNVHKFTYFSDIPYGNLMGTKQIDFWGYFNGYPNNSMIPDYNAFREPNYELVFNGMLKKVTYPTGGASEFQYEPNTFSYNYLQPYKAIRTIRAFKEFQYYEGEVIFGEEDSIVISYPSRYQILISTDGEPLEDLVHCPENMQTGTLEPGVYHALSWPIMSVTCLNTAPPGVTITLRLEVELKDTTGVIDGKNMNYYGGLRVRSVKTMDTNGETIHYNDYLYDDFADTTRTSGVVSEIGNYSLTGSAGLTLRTDNTEIFTWTGGILGIDVHSFYNEPYNSMQLSPLMYFNVRERTRAIDNQISQESKYYYTSYLDGYPDSRGEPVDGGITEIGPKEKYDFARSNIQKIEKIRSGDNFIVQSDSTGYVSGGEMLSSDYYAIKGLFRLFFTTITVHPPEPYLPTVFSFYYNKIYHTFSCRHYLKSKKTTVFGTSANDFVETQTTYHYDDAEHLQLTRTRTTQSNGYISETRMKYPLDYDSVSVPAPYIRKMINKHMVSYPLETLTILEKDSSHRYVVNADISTYREFQGNANKDTLVLPYKKFSFLNNAYLLPLSSYSSYDGTSDEVSSANFREVMRYNAYDTRGNILNLLYNKKDNVSYLWSYKSQYPVAEIKNASASEVAIALSTLSTSVATLGAMTDSDALKLKLDGLRAALPASLITSYLYKPLVGVKTVTSPNLLNTYYEYDVFNRLRRIKDNDLKTVKRMDYHYATE